MADRQDLERVQKAALKVILRGEYEDYEQALGLLNLESLNQRRECMALKFAKNGLKDPKFSKLFPLRESKHEMIARNSEKYYISKSNTLRHMESSVPFLQRLLNKDSFERKMSLKRLLRNDLTKKPKKEKYNNNDPSFRVNYVLNVDAIT